MRERTNDYRNVTADEVIATFSPERQKKINERGADLIAEELALRKLSGPQKDLWQGYEANLIGGQQ